MAGRHLVLLRHGGRRPAVPAWPQTPPTPGPNSSIPGSADIPVLGGTSPSTEDIINLDPDLVIIHPTTAKDGFAQQLRELGIPAININFSNYETMAQAYTILGTILGGEISGKAVRLVRRNRKEKADSHRELTSGLSEEEKPVVYYIAGQSENLLSTMGAASAGTTNIMQDWVESNGGLYGPAVINLAGNEITAEQVFAMNPDVIMVGGIYQHVLLDQVMNSDGWKDLDAVKNGRVYNNPYACFNWDRFGMESLLQADYAFMCLQPEIAAEQGVDRDYMINTVIEFYEYYNGTVLTEEQAGFMLDGLMPDGTAEIPAA